MEKFLGDYYKQNITKRLQKLVSLLMKNQQKLQFSDEASNY